jgi:hypothetical protein
MWTQFRRLLLGTVVEVFQEHGIQTDVATLELSFHDDSDFKVPRLNNYMRFKGHVRAPLDADVPSGALHAVRRDLLGVWPDLLQVVKIPVGDKLTSDKNQVDVQVVSRELRVQFDLIAD